MGKKIYVGNLPFTVGEQDLNSMFSVHGNVESAKIIIDRDTGRSKGFAFVEMSTDSEASNAIAKLHETEQFGRNLNVTEAKPLAPRQNRGGSSNGFKSNRY